MLAAIVWVAREKNRLSIIATFGSMLSVSSIVLRLVVNEVTSSYAGYRYPGADQNSLVWFIFIHGVNFGYLIFLIAFTIDMIKRKKA